MDDTAGDTTTTHLGNHAQQIMRIAQDTEYLHSFLRVDYGVDKEEAVTGKGKQMKRLVSSGQLMKGERDRPRTPATPPPAGPASFSQLSKEIKAKSKEAPVKHVRGRRIRVRRQEEVYTDKDRAAAVNMGSRDIKHSLKMKRRQDRSQALQIPEEADPATLLALGAHELRNGDVRIAVNFVNKALELSPTDKNALVTRSKCYLLLGQPDSALKDAEAALSEDKNYIKAIYQKAEALYQLGDFEHSLMYHHRGLRIRPELEGFRLGVQKSQEAIENTIGSQKGGNLVVPKPLDELESMPASSVQHTSCLSAGLENAATRKSRSSFGHSKKQQEQASKRTERHLLGDLYIDKQYLQQLLSHPDIKCMELEASKNNILAHAKDGVNFLRNRQQFWRQQKPNAPTTKK